MGISIKPSVLVRSIRSTLGIDVGELLERVLQLEAQLAQLSLASDEDRVSCMNS